jgi:hypothetical protein
MAQRGYEEEGNGSMYAYTNLHARFYPSAGEHIVMSKLISGDDLNLDEDLVLLDSIEMTVSKSGKVQLRFDGSIQSPVGHQILLAVSDHPGYTLQDGSVILTSPTDDFDRHPFIHSRVYDVEPGTHTFYVMTQFYQSVGFSTIDVHGHFLAKYFPENTVHTQKVTEDLSIDVLPNPANSHITIQCEQASHDIHVSVFDLDGRLILNTKIMSPGEPIDISKLSTGMYMVRVRNGNMMGIEKLVKI